MASSYSVLPSKLRFQIVQSLLHDSRLIGSIETTRELRAGPVKYETPNGTLPVGTKTERCVHKLLGGWIEIHTHQYILPGVNGGPPQPKGEPDPLFIKIDDVVLKRFQDTPEALWNPINMVG